MGGASELEQEASCMCNDRTLLYHGRQGTWLGANSKVCLINNSVYMYECVCMCMHTHGRGRLGECYAHIL